MLAFSHFLAIVTDISGHLEHTDLRLEVKHTTRTQSFDSFVLVLISLVRQKYVSRNVSVTDKNGVNPA